MAPRLQTPGAPTREVPMRVIVHGLHRTGSMSTRTALHQLGFHNCYHMISAIQNVDTDADLWIRATQAKFGAKGDKWTREDWDKLLGDSQACVDVPSALFTLQLAEAYPEAKIVILNRDAERWYESVVESIMEALELGSVLRIVRNLYLTALIPQHRQWMRLRKMFHEHGMPTDPRSEKEKTIAWFKNSYREVRDAIAADRCLEFSVQDGFRPLCEFLGVPVPMVRDETTGEMVEAPFPHVNDRASFLAERKRVDALHMHRANSALWTHFCQAVTLGLMGYAGYRFWKQPLEWAVRKMDLFK
ncbi:hypothetical protein E4U41_001408 [Claviceps citrina]|nr:hypothetical protein E4U41_001408 [Claviceps citrina]